MSSVHNTESVRTQTSDAAGAPAFVNATRTYPNAKGEVVEDVVVRPVMAGTFTPRVYDIAPANAAPIDVPALSAQVKNFLKQPWPPGKELPEKLNEQMAALQQQIKSSGLFALNEGKNANADSVGMAIGGGTSGKITLG